MKAMTGCCEVTAEERTAISESRDQAERLAAAFKALSDETRVRIVQRLMKASQPLCECHLVELFDLSQPTISYHLKQLKEAGVVEAKKRGVWTYYWISPRTVLDVLRMLTALA